MKYLNFNILDARYLKLLNNTLNGLNENINLFFKRINIHRQSYVCVCGTSYMNVYIFIFFVYFIKVATIQKLHNFFNF